MNLTEPIGWITFLLGVSIMIFTIYQSYNIFTGKIEAPEIFEQEVRKTQAPTEITTTQSGIQEMISEQLKGILPVGSIYKLLNLSVWTIFAGIFLFAGTQIAGLGIKLIKK